MYPGVGGRRHALYLGQQAIIQHVDSEIVIDFVVPLHVPLCMMIVAVLQGNLTFLTKALLKEQVIISLNFRLCNGSSDLLCNSTQVPPQTYYNYVLLLYFSFSLICFIGVKLLEKKLACCLENKSTLFLLLVFKFAKSLLLLQSIALFDIFFVKKKT